MIKSLKEKISNLSIRNSAALLLIVFLLAIFISRWVSFNSETIEQSMVLHHEEEAQLTEKEQKMLNIQINEMKKLLFCYKELKMPLKIS